MAGVTSYRDLQVWQRAMDLATVVYQLADFMPKKEEFRLTGQMLRAAASVPANIAEGHMRSTRKDYANFVNIARGSLAEQEMFLMLAERVQTGAALQVADEVGRMLTVLRQRLMGHPYRPTPNPYHPTPNPYNVLKPR
jgi:four helix bundle protein